MITINAPTHEQVKTTQLLAIAERLLAESYDLTTVQIIRAGQYHPTRTLCVTLTKNNKGAVTEIWDVQAKD